LLGRQKPVADRKKPENTNFHALEVNGKNEIPWSEVEGTNNLLPFTSDFARQKPVADRKKSENTDFYALEVDGKRWHPLIGSRRN